LVEVFRGVRRVLRDDGLAWLNLGDTYSGGGGYWPSAPGNQNAGSLSSRQDNGSGAKPVGPYYKGLPSGNLIGVPWRVALALQHDGWVLRQDVIWSKMSCMPSSVRNRCTTSHEYVFLLAKKMGYYYDADAVKEKGGGHKTGGPMNYKGVSGREYGWQNKDAVYQSANKRSVWHISNEGGYEHSHFATFPKKLVEPCILAGTSAKGACVKCGAPWQRVVDERTIIRNRSTPFVKRTGQAGTGNSCPNDVGGVSSRTVGWYPTCKCDGLPELPKEPPAGGGWNATKESADGTYKIQGNGCPSDDNWDRVNGIRGEDYDNWVDEVTKLCEAAKDIPTTPCVVLDPFCGSGTTAVVSLQHGRHAVGIELSKQYMDLHIIPRMNRCVVNPFAETKQFREKNNKLLGKLVQKDRIPKLPKGK
jgi:DNA modification methylase